MWERIVLSDDLRQGDKLLPNKKDYVDKDLGTRSLAEAIQGDFNSRLSMIYYDATRKEPLLYFTTGKHQSAV